MEGGEGSSTRTRPSLPISRMPKYLSPFMTRLHAMVNDPTTDALISWGSSGTSIIIWDHLAFERNILPKFFKHSNLSSFVYQLNNYGFRKIGVLHEWEYENPYFQRGKESWLANIKCRNKKRKVCSNSTNNELETELEILKNEIEESKLEIEKLNKKQAEMELQIEEIKNTDGSEKLTMLLTKAYREIHADEANKKRNLGNPEIPTENEELNEINAGAENVNEKVDQNQEEMLEGELNSLSENQSIGVSSDESANHFDKGYGFNLNSEPKEIKESADYAFWDQMMLDDSCEQVCDDGEMSDWKRKGQAEIEAELEGLIANLPNQDAKPVH